MEWNDKWNDKTSGSVLDDLQLVQQLTTHTSK